MRLPNFLPKFLDFAFVVLATGSGFAQTSPLLPVSIPSTRYEKMFAPAADDLVLQNEMIQIVIDPDGAQGVRAFIDRANGHDFIKLDDGVPLYAITSIAEHAGLEGGDYPRKRVTSAEGKLIGHHFEAHSNGDQTLTLKYRHESQKYQVIATLNLPKNARYAFWRISIDNGSRDALMNVAYPGLALPMVATQEPDQTRILFPNSKHSFLFHDLPKEFQHYKGTTPYPFTLAWGEAPQTLPLMAYYTDLTGLYIGAEDPVGHIKNLRIIGLNDETIELRMTHVRTWEFGQPFADAYPIRTEIFQGDWTMAADIYRTWAYQQSWCGKGALYARKDYPHWLLAHSNWSRIYLANPHGDGIRANLEPAKVEDLLDPAKVERFVRSKQIPFQLVLKKLREGTPNPLVAGNTEVNLIGWERLHWWGGYYDGHFPLWMGEDKFRDFIGELREAGYHIGMEPFGWRTLTLSPHGSDYFNITNRKDYQHFWHDVLSRQEGIPDKPPTSVKELSSIMSICPATEYAQEVFTRMAKVFAPMGVDIIQIMEIDILNHGDCHNVSHGHSRGKGAWILAAIRQAFVNYAAAGRAGNPNFATQIEETHDMIIDVCDSFLDRNNIFGYGGNSRLRYNPYHADISQNNVPLFGYVYHAYTTIYNPWESSGVELLNRYGAGRATVLGSPTGYLHGGNPDNQAYQQAITSGAYEIQAIAMQAAISFAKDYYVFGEMLPEPGLDFSDRLQTFKMTIHAPQGQWGSPATMIAGYNYRAGKLGGVKGENFARQGPELTHEFRVPSLTQGAFRSPTNGVGITIVNVTLQPQEVTIRPEHLTKYAKVVGDGLLTITIYEDLKQTSRSQAKLIDFEPPTVRLPPKSQLFLELKPSSAVSVR